MKLLFQLLTGILLFTPFCLFTQPSYTANDDVPAYNEPLYFGTNLGWYSAAWPDDKLADIAAGNADLGVAGAGCQNLRITLPEHFLRQWGYSVERSDIEHYHALGMRELTVFLQGPSDEHQLTQTFCNGEQSPELFNNMYEPIWDNGENDTPVNDNNHFALYVYNTVNEYKDYVRFWEIINEPDFTSSDYGWRPSGMEGSWYDAAPNPCDLKNLKAPVYYYIRALRIAYEVIKTVDESAYVAVGGIGYASFLDAILRYTDNPSNGETSGEYPLAGGAYFDCLSYHAYPANDGSLRYRDEVNQVWVHTRHSDAAADGVIRLKNDFQDVLNARGYGSTYPNKRFIVTESNVSRKMFNDQMGSMEGQRNFTPKVMVNALQNGIDQFYTYTLGDVRSEAAASNSWQLMGFYYELAAVQPNGEQITPNGIAFRTTADFLHEYQYDASLTTQMDLPDEVGGGGFVNSEGETLFVLWAKTTEDLSENASTMYTFPASMGVMNINQREWDFSETGTITPIAGSTVDLTASPIFLTANVTTKTVEAANEISEAKVIPNPLTAEGVVKIILTETTAVTISLLQANGQLIRQVTQDQSRSMGTHQWQIDTDDLAAGWYQCRIQTEQGTHTVKLVVVK